ncbi:MAG: hypothetical protein QM496_11655 [Verrucomicrobiota bacterium]
MPTEKETAELSPPEPSPFTLAEEGQESSPSTSTSSQSLSPIQVRKHKRKKRINLWPAAYVIYLLTVATYFTFISKDRYVSEARFVVTRGGETAISGGAMSLMVGTSQTQQDAYTAIAYLLSIDMLRWLEKDGDINFKQHFKDAGLDIFHQLPADAQIEQSHRFYQKRVTAFFDDVEGIVTMDTEGFNPEFAEHLAIAILKRSEAYLNELNRDIANQRLVFVIEELDLSEDKLDEARKKLIAFQNEKLIVDPEADIQARLGLIQELKKAKVFKQAELVRLTRESPLAPRIKELAAEISAIEDEMTRESNELTGEGPDQLNQLFAQYSKLRQDITFATERYGQSLRVVEEMRVQTLQQHRFLSVVQQPFLPEDSVRPRRLYWSITFAVLGIMLLQIFRLVIRTVADHR